jgi:hypothetical protein
MRYAHIFCGWSKRLKPNESRRAFIRSAWLCFVASTSRSHAPRALLDEAIDRSASGSEIPVAAAAIRQELEEERSRGLYRGGSAQCAAPALPDQS